MDELSLSSSKDLSQMFPDYVYNEPSLSNKYIKKMPIKYKNNNNNNITNNNNNNSNNNANLKPIMYGYDSNITNITSNHSKSYSKHFNSPISTNDQNYINDIKTNESMTLYASNIIPLTLIDNLSYSNNNNNSNNNDNNKIKYKYNEDNFSLSSLFKNKVSKSYDFDNESESSIFDKPKKNKFHFKHNSSLNNFLNEISDDIEIEREITKKQEQKLESMTNNDNNVNTFNTMHKIPTKSRKQRYNKPMKRRKYHSNVISTSKQHHPKINIKKYPLKKSYSIEQNNYINTNDINNDYINDYDTKYFDYKMLKTNNNNNSNIKQCFL